jgi:manganese oxidase
MFVIEERTTTALAADREEIMLLGDGTLGYIVNGKGFPDIPAIEMTMGERVRVRMANLGAMPMHLHGGFFDVVIVDDGKTPLPDLSNHTHH